REEADRFQSIVFYLGQRDELEKMIPIFGFNPEQDFEIHSTWMAGWQILDSLGVEILPSENLNELENKYFNFYRDVPVVMEGASFSGFAEIDYGSARIADSTLEMVMEWEGSQLSIHKQGELLLSLSMDSLLKSNLSKQHNLLAIDPKKLEFDIESENGK